LQIIDMGVATSTIQTMERDGIRSFPLPRSLHHFDCFKIVYKDKHVQHIMLLGEEHVPHPQMLPTWQLLISPLKRAARQHKCIDLFLESNMADTFGESVSPYPVPGRPRCKTAFGDMQVGSATFSSNFPIAAEAMPRFREYFSPTHEADVPAKVQGMQRELDRVRRREEELAQRLQADPSSTELQTEIHKAQHDQWFLQSLIKFFNAHHQAPPHIMRALRHHGIDTRIPMMPPPGHLMEFATKTMHFHNPSQDGDLFADAVPVWNWLDSSSACVETVVCRAKALMGLLDWNFNTFGLHGTRRVESIEEYDAMVAEVDNRLDGLDVAGPLTTFRDDMLDEWWTEPSYGGTSKEREFCDMVNYLLNFRDTLHKQYRRFDGSLADIVGQQLSPAHILPYIEAMNHALPLNDLDIVVWPMDCYTFYRMLVHFDNRQPRRKVGCPPFSENAIMYAGASHTTNVAIMLETLKHLVDGAAATATVHMERRIVRAPDRMTQEFTVDFDDILTTWMCLPPTCPDDVLFNFLDEHEVPTFRACDDPKRALVRHNEPYSPSPDMWQTLDDAERTRCVPRPSLSPEDVRLLRNERNRALALERAPDIPPHTSFFTNVIRDPATDTVQFPIAQSSDGRVGLWMYTSPLIPLWKCNNEDLGPMAQGCEFGVSRVVTETSIGNMWNGEHTWISLQALNLFDSFEAFRAGKRRPNAVVAPSFTNAVVPLSAPSGAHPTHIEVPLRSVTAADMDRCRHNNTGTAYFVKLWDFPKLTVMDFKYYPELDDLSPAFAAEYRKVCGFLSRKEVFRPLSAFQQRMQDRNKLASIGEDEEVYDNHPH
jgi:hypothetical protein